MNGLRRFLSTAKDPKAEWRTIIGLEIHAQLATAQKLFSPAFNDSDSPANNNVDPLDAANPGSLPVLNWDCVALAVRAALLLNCTVQRESAFDRKHYHCADLPAGYQITQHRRPIAREGWLEIPGGGNTTVAIRQIQLEQDSAKTLHYSQAGIDSDRASSGGSSIDLNRCGVGLIEIVTDPVLTSAEDAMAFAKGVWQLLVDGGVCRGILAQGHMRFDANVSVTGPRAPADAPPLGVRVEIKNVNTFQGLRRAIAAEAQRQISLLEAGHGVQRETRSYDEQQRTTVATREKEPTLDYRMIPEFDVPSLILNDVFIEAVRKTMPETRPARYTRLWLAYSLEASQVDVLLTQPGLLGLFEDLVAAVGGSEDSNRSIYNFLVNKYLGELRKRRIPWEESPISVSSLARIIRSLLDGSRDSMITMQRTFSI